MEFSRIVDISLPVRAGMIAYPGNPEFAALTVPSKTSYLSKLTLGTHTGTHVDAPRHASEAGKGVDEFPLDVFLGPCRVLDLRGAKERITVVDLAPFDIKKGERILTRTSNSDRGFAEFYPDYVWLDPEAAKYLAEKGIVLFGIDYLSVKQKGSPDNRPHTELLEKGIAIFEGLDLSGAEPGEYVFVGLPLRLEGLDGAPARAVLLAP